MKNFFYTTLLFAASTNIATATNPVVIENPPFDYNTHSNVTIEKIVMNDTSTTLHMVVYQRQGQWIRIAADSYIDAGGKKLKLQSAEDIQLDQEVYPDESGKIIFSLIFPPVDLATQQIDFIESDCDDCFKTYGLKVKPVAQYKRTGIPQKIKDAAIKNEDGQALEIPRLKAENATLKGGFIGYVTTMKWSVNVYVDNPVTGIQEELETKVNDDGSFELTVPMVTSMQVLLRIPTGMSYNNYNILLTPGKESSIYFDLQQKSCQETPIEALRCPAAKYVWFDGANAEINNQIEDINLTGLLQRTLYQRNDSAVATMTAEQYKSYILDKASDIIDNLAQKGLTKKTMEFASLLVRYSATQQLMFARYHIEDAFRRSHKLDYDAPMTGFTTPIVDDAFYSFLKEPSINSSYALYSCNYSNIINSCIYLEPDGQSIHLDFVLKDDVQALINSGKLSPEELKVALYLKDRTPDNADSPYNKAEKQKLAKFAQEVLNTGKLNDKQQEEVNRFLSLCADPTTTKLTVMEQMAPLQIKLLNDGILTRKEINDIMVAITEQNTTTTDSVSPEQLTAFNEKYDEVLNQRMREQNIKEKKATLSRIIGTDSGIASELMTTQLICNKMSEFIPLTADELKTISQLENPFYYDYIRDKNNRLVAQIEENKRKSNYTIHDTPKTNGEQAFSEIVKPFEGKVVLVDFWNTWCGPCRSAMKQFETAKNTFKEKGVVFIYLADESSPLNTWKNMISSIPGEHFRLKNSQMNELRKKFGIRGIPSYLILNRNGEQIYFKTGFYIVDIGNKLKEALK